MRILCVADEYPWPATMGYRIRLSGILDGLMSVGDVDLFCTVSERADLPAGDVDPPPHGLARLHIHRRPPLSSSVAGLVRWARGEWPRSVALRDWPGSAAALASFRRDRYDVIWYSHGEAWLALADATGDEPTLVDLDNLESEILRAHAAAEPDPSEPLRTRVRSAARRRADRIDAGRWTAAERAAAERSRGAIVCSELDASRLAHPRAVVVPNGYDEQAPPSPPAGHVLAMVGLLVYKPNVEGARWFAHQVLPLVRARVPDASFRLIGRSEGSTRLLGELDGVELLGEVDDVGGALAGAAAVVVPLRSGSGTRIKVLEAFARRYPVASTTLGCEGLGVVDGAHALIGDSPAELADACVRLLTEPELARDIAEGGWRMWDERYRWSVIHERVRDVVAAAAEAR